MSGKIYLLPNSLGNNDYKVHLPDKVKEIILALKYIIVEDIRNARRYLKSIDKSVIIDEITFFELNKHTQDHQLDEYLRPSMEGKDTGVLSEAGLPGIADPGAKIVKIAHIKGLKVVPLTGPSSIFMALMSSGFNGQSFKFHGYLPIQKNDRKKRIKEIEQKAINSGETQIFIETPYRNNSLLNEIIQTCEKTTLLSIAADLTLETEFIKAMPVSKWESAAVELHKRPAVFLINKS